MQKLFYFIALVKFEHTIFALPFVYIGGILGYNQIMPFYYWFWMTLAMVGARTGGMLFNRIIDVEIDKKNPRTANRPIITGGITKKEASLALFASLVLFFFSAYKLNLVCFSLSPIALFLLWSYPFTKRFTYLSHFYLGLCLSCAPIGGFLATNLSLNLPILILAIFVVLWVAGFDIIYAILDIDFDREQNLHSIPAKFGLKKALMISFILHVISFFILVLFGILLKFGIFYWVFMVLIAYLFLRQHLIIKDLSRINESFFTMNALVSILLFIFIFLYYALE